jgi:hypothetical protein
MVSYTLTYIEESTVCSYLMKFQGLYLNDGYYS